MLLQSQLQRPVEPLQIPYPPGFQGAKSGNPDDREFHISTLPRWLTQDELTVAEQYLTKLPYAQSVSKTGAVLIDEDDPLLSASHDEIDQAEVSAQLPNTRFVLRSERCIYDRVLLLRERGYKGGSFKALTSTEP